MVDDLAADDFESLRKVTRQDTGSMGAGCLLIKNPLDIQIRLRSRPNRQADAIRAELQEDQGRPHYVASGTTSRRGCLRLPSCGRFVDAADGQLKAMVLLGINAGLGNADCGQLKIRNVDMATGWLNYPRPKTGILTGAVCCGRKQSRHSKQAIDARPEPKDDANRELVFITKYGGSWFQGYDRGEFAGATSSLSYCLN